MVRKVNGVVIILALLVYASLIPSACCAQWDKAVQQIPSLRSLPDVTDQLQRQINDNGGLLLDAKHYRISGTLEIDLSIVGSSTIRATDGTTLIMDGPGPALRFKGTHAGTASPKSFQPKTWNERMPIVSGIEILGAHPEADGIELDSTVGAIINDVSIRWCHDAIHLVNRNRNVIISDCHLYQNSGIGVFLDDVNLHQINVNNSHVSYNRDGGIVVRDGNVRNLQVSGCDIEGNMPADETPTRTANVLIDVAGSPRDASKSVAEIAITGCTIQHAANYSGSEEKTVAPGGANIRLAGKKIYPIDSVTITGNVLSDTTTNVDIDYANDVVVSANNFFAPKPTNLSVSNSRRVVVIGNTFNPRQFVRPGMIRFSGCTDCVIANSTIHRFATTSGAIALIECSGMMINGLQLSDCGSGIFLNRTTDSTISTCRVMGTAAGGLDVSIPDSNRNIRLVGNVFTGTTEIDSAAVIGPPASSVDRE